MKGIKQIVATTINDLPGSSKDDDNKFEDCQFHS